MIAEHCDAVATPAFILDELELSRAISRFVEAQSIIDCSVLYSVKACACAPIVRKVLSQCDGFSCSSWFEAQLIRNIGGENCQVSYVSPIVRSHELEALAATCNRITFNSLSQLDRFACQLSTCCELGVRINPGLSFVSDPRYDPCRTNSKLGIPLRTVRKALRSEPLRFQNVSGIHFHTNCDSQDSGQLLLTIAQLESELGDEMGRFRWLNVGGGYTFDDLTMRPRIGKELRRLRERYGLEIVFEPGAAFVRSAGSIVATVEDIIEGDSQVIAVLDTTVNHWPEVFEYQFEPDVDGHIDDGQFTYLLAGCSCLAGDLFGVYSFDVPLTIGSRIVFKNAGAYSIAKAHMFNGINLPTVYSVTEAGELVLINQCTYEVFASKWGVDTRAAIGT